MSRHSDIYIHRTFTYNCINTEQCLEILEKIDELSLEVDMHVEFKPNKLVFKLIGLEPNVQSAMAKIRNFLSLYNSSKIDPRKGISSDIIAKHIKKTIPLDVLVIVIRKTLGIYAEVRGINIYVDTDLDTVLTISKKIAEAQQKIEQLPLANALKKLLVAAMAIYNISHIEILEILHNMQYLNEENELIAPWTNVLEELDKVLNTI